MCQNLLPRHRRRADELAKLVCRHCNRLGCVLTYRLCWKCNRTPAIRALYPMASQRGRRNWVATPKPPRARPSGPRGKRGVPADPAIQRGLKCRHCQERPINRPRGLCWRCFYTPEIRTLHQPKGKQSNDAYRTAPLPKEATQAKPGTEEKLQVLEQRARAKLSLWHPADPVDPWEPERGERIYRVARKVLRAVVARESW